MLTAKITIIKNVKNVVFAYVLCAFLSTTSEKIVSVFGILFVVWSFFYNKERSFQQSQCCKYFRKNIGWLTALCTIAPVKEQKGYT